MAHDRYRTIGPGGRVNHVGPSGRIGTPSGTRRTSVDHVGGSSGALDVQNAERLWETSETLVGDRFAP
jgi:hypothetical protein